MTWQGKRALVTGAGGFIGSHLTERLVELGATTRALVHYQANGSGGWLDHSPHRSDVEIIAGDVCDRDSVAQAAHGMDVIFHLAALIAIPYSYQAPFSYVQANVEGTLNVLLAAREVGVERIVHTSTSEVYGTARYVPIDEAHPLQAQSPYAACKIGADKLVESFHLSFGLPAVTVRPFNTFGPRQSLRAVIPTIIGQCLAGDTVHLGHVRPTRDFSYVANTVEGFILAAQAPAAVGRVVNLGSGREISIADLVHVIGGLLGRQVMIKTEDERRRPEQSEVQRLCANNALARELLGWKPGVSLEEGLRLTIDWIRQHAGDYQTTSYVV